MLKNPTRTQGDSATLIDVVLVNSPINISATGIFPCSFSDHDMIGCIRKQNHLKFKNRTLKSRNYKNYDPNVVCNELSQCNWDTFYNCTDVNSAWGVMKSFLLTIIDRHAPFSERKIKGKPCPWMTNELKRGMINRDRLLVKARKTKSHSDRKAFRQKRRG